MDTNTNISGLLPADEEFLVQVIGQSVDINYRHLTLPILANTPALLVQIKGLVDTAELEDSIIAPLMTRPHLDSTDTSGQNTDLITRLMDCGLSVAGVKASQLWSEICDAIVSGDSVLFIDQQPSALILANRGWKQRGISEPTAEIETRGSKDCFVEDIMVNMAMIRRRIRDYSLRFESFKVGQRTKTDISLVYIGDLVNPDLLNEVRNRFAGIQTDAVTSSSSLEELTEDAAFSVFPTTEHTERPDKACAALLEGRIVILVDNNPFPLIIPAGFWNFIQVPGDYFERYYIGTFWRLLRLLAIFLTLSSTSAYVLLTSFHQEMLPTSLALKLASGRLGVPFPSVIEAIIMEIIFEIMTEAGVRMPKALGQTVSIIGTLVIGQGAVTAGLVGPALLIAVAVGAISSFAIPSFSMTNAIRLLRFPLLLLSASLGLFGYLGGIIVINLHLMSMRSFGTPFYAPMSPWIGSDQKDTVLRVPRWKMILRPKMFRPKDQVRESSDLQPKPDPQ